MGFRYRKSIRVGKYFRINVSKSGVGYSFGVPGARITHSPNGRVTTTVGIPGTGLSYSESHGGSSARSARSSHNRVTAPPPSVPRDTGIGTAQSTEIADIADLQPAELSDMLGCLRKVQSVNSFGTAFLWIGLILTVGFMLNAAKAWPLAIVTFLFMIGGIVLKIHAHTKLPVSLEYDIDEETARQHNARIAAWQNFFSSASKWQIITSAAVTNQKINAGATSTVSRAGVSMSQKAPFYIRTNVTVAVLNFKSVKLLILPDKMIVIKGGTFGAADYCDISISTRKGRFIESGAIPRDAEVVGHTWQYVNKNGSPDKRYNNNRQLPVCLYGYVTIRSGAGLEIQLCCSNNSKIDGLG